MRKLIAVLLLTACSESPQPTVLTQQTKPAQPAKAAEQANTQQETPFIALNSEPANYAWWLRAKYRPNGTLVRGISIKTINRDWCFANEFTMTEHMGVLSGKEYEELNSIAKFSIPKALDDGTETLVTTGIYEKCSGESGNFILTLSSQSNHQVISFLELSKDNPRFMTISSNENGEVELWWCLECDHSTHLLWDGDTKNFVIQPHEEIDAI